VNVGEEVRERLRVVSNEWMGGVWWRQRGGGRGAIGNEGGGGQDPTDEWRVSRGGRRNPLPMTE
jgi:hypothetical protein